MALNIFLEELRYGWIQIGNLCGAFVLGYSTGAVKWIYDGNDKVNKY